MNPSSGRKTNFISRYLNVQKSRIRGCMGATERLSYLRQLKRWRTRVIHVKLFANIWFLFACITQGNEDTYGWYTLFGGSGDTVWKFFSIYAAVSICLPLFSLIGLLYEGSIVSQAWFEVLWLFGVSVFDLFLIMEGSLYTILHYGGPYFAIEVTSFVFTIAALAIDLSLSLFWSGFLVTAAWFNYPNYRTIWVSHAGDFPWLLPGTPPDVFPSLRKLICGTRRQPSPSQAIPARFRRWLTNFGLFRRFSTMEPISLCLIRGVVALVIWIILLAYGFFNCVINPIRQFTNNKGLPLNSIAWDSMNMTTYGPISGFIALKFMTDSSFRFNQVFTRDILGRIIEGMEANYRYESSDEVISCRVSDPAFGYIPHQDQSYAEFIVPWYCGPIWDVLGFRDAVPTDPKPYLSVVWNSSAYVFPEMPLLYSGLTAFSATANETYFPTASDVFRGGALKYMNGLTLKFQMGQNLRVDVGRRRTYTKRGTFLDFIGIAQSPEILLSYPILSVTPNVTSPDPNVTSIEFYPGFGMYNDDIFEEYLEHTFLKGLSTTGGLYTAFDVIFALLFGRSLLAALFGGKQITPFGAIAAIINKQLFCKKLQTGYPGIDGSDPNKRAQATCTFLHDFILDLTPLKMKPIDESDESSTLLGRVQDGSEVSDGQRGMELTDRTSLMT